MRLGNRESQEEAKFVGKAGCFIMLKRDALRLSKWRCERQLEILTNCLEKRAEPNFLRLSTEMVVYTGVDKFH